MTKIKKLLYLLQLEEYQTDRYYSWLKNYQINNLVEKKGKLKWTFRCILTFLTSFFIPFTTKERSIGISNNLVDPFLKIIGQIFILFTKIKLFFYPNLTKIVITGSYGKTSFKELLSYLLSEKYFVLKTPENINTKLGIAQLIIKKLNKNHQILIVEAGTYKSGEIKSICELIRPSIGVITAIGWMHLERFGSLGNIRKAKFELADFIKVRKYFFAPDENNKFIDFNNTAIKICLSLGISESDVKKKIAVFPAPEHRLSKKIINKNLIILDDTYNSNPLGFEKALQELSSFKNYQKIVVTPGMIELGEMQFTLNNQAAQKITGIADILVVASQVNKEALSSIKNPPKNFKILFQNRDTKIEDILTGYFNPPTIILLENDLPDHYF